MLALGLSAFVVLIISILIIVLITQALWNFVMPAVFNTQKIDFWHTFALLFLSNIFFGGHCNSSSIYFMNTLLT